MSELRAARGRLPAAELPGHTRADWVLRLARARARRDHARLQRRDPGQLAAELTGAAPPRRRDPPGRDRRGGRRRHPARGRPRQLLPRQPRAGRRSTTALTRRSPPRSPASSRRGVNLNLAPVADVNTNPHNPVIGVRSFGADPELSRGTSPRSSRARSARRRRLREALPGPRRHLGRLAPRPPRRRRATSRPRCSVPRRDRRRRAGGDDRHLLVPPSTTCPARSAGDPHGSCCAASSASTGSSSPTRSRCARSRAATASRRPCGGSPPAADAHCRPRPARGCRRDGPRAIAAFQAS